MTRAAVAVCRDCKQPRSVDHDCPEAGRQDAIEAAGRLLARMTIRRTSRSAS